MSESLPDRNEPTAAEQAARALLLATAKRLGCICWNEDPGRGLLTVPACPVHGEKAAR